MQPIPTDLTGMNQANRHASATLETLSCQPAMQERHINTLFSQAQQLSQQLVTAQADASTAQAAAAATRHKAAQVSLQLEAALSEADALRRAAAAATQEAAGVAQWCLNKPPGCGLQGGVSINSSGHNMADGDAAACRHAAGQESVGEALRRRDEGLIKCFEARVAGLQKQGQSQQVQLGGSGSLAAPGQQSYDDTRLMQFVREVCI